MSYTVYCPRLTGKEHDDDEDENDDDDDDDEPLVLMHAQLGVHTDMMP